MTILVSHEAVPPTFYNKIRPWQAQNSISCARATNPP